MHIGALAARRVPHTAAAAPRADSVTAVLPGPPKKRRRRSSTAKNAATIIKNCVKSIVKRVVKTYDREVTVQVKLLLKFMVQRVATTPEQLHAQQEARLQLEWQTVALHCHCHWWACDSRCACAFPRPLPHA